MPLQFKIVAFDSIDSTNEDAKRRIKSGDISDRLLITSKVQTSGKGRYSKGWVSADGNMFASIVIKIDTSLSEAALYSFVTAIAVGEAIREFVSNDVTAQYKWPNDVMLDGKKVSGILLETLKDNNGCKWLIIGTGVNINNQPEDVDKQVTSLMSYASLSVSVECFLAKFIQHFETQEKLWKSTGFACIRSAWLKNAYKLGEEITVNLKTQVFKGKFYGISNSGELEVLVDGKKLLICGGEVFFGE